jgi:hypothetical protein
VPDKSFDLSGYVQVNERIKLFYELFAGGRLVTETVDILTAPDGVQRVMVRALAYRSVDDPHPGVGTSWLQIPGSTPYTRGSEVENAETSAWGRAIGSLGILIDKSIASANEIENKQDGGIVSTSDHPVSESVDGGLIGELIASGNHDFLIREAPGGSLAKKGWTLPFRIKNGRSSFIALAHDDLAQILYGTRARWINQRVTVWGWWTDESIPAKGNKPQINYRILHVQKITGPDGTVTADPDPEPALPEPPEEIPLPFEAVG